ncbi:hypothetical protein RDI58_021564 [Solanum bulbocastanum]|uniref:Glucosamine 6-phosphate N-acetyltransferase n=1 Tax=Solanum bulbocastanum TaxID=147425 RepID=A0AAN8Y4H7_SOLBU
MMQSENSVEDSLHIRKLEVTDKEKGFIELLRQLTVCDSVSDEKFKERFEEIAKYGDDHCICVIEDVRSGKIVATGSVFIEKKFVRNCGKAGHIEDVVVDSSARGMQLGKRIVEYLADHAHSMGCYKIIRGNSIDINIQHKEDARTRVKKVKNGISIINICHVVPKALEEFLRGSRHGLVKSPHGEKHIQDLGNETDLEM